MPKRAGALPVTRVRKTTNSDFIDQINSADFLRGRESRKLNVVVGRSATGD